MAQQRYLSWGEETTYGTAAASVANRVDIAGESLELKHDLSEIRPARLHAPDRQHRARRAVRGSFDPELGWSNVGELLRYLVGAPTTTGPSGGQYTHVFVPDPQEAVPSVTLDVAREQEGHRYLGCFFPGAVLPISLGQRHFGMRIDVQGSDETTYSVPTTTESEFEAPIHVGDASANSALAATLDDGSTSWSARFDSLEIQLRSNRRLREPSRSAVPTGFTPATIWAVSGRLKWLYDADTQFLLNAYRNRTSVSFEVEFTDTIISVAHSLKWEMPSTVIDGRPPTVRGAGWGNIDFSLDHTALYDSTVSGPFRVTLKNTVASY